MATARTPLTLRSHSNSDSILNKMMIALDDENDALILQQIRQEIKFLIEKLTTQDLKTISSLAFAIVDIFKTLRNKRKDLLELEETIKKQDCDVKNMNNEISDMMERNKKTTLHIEELIEENNKRIESQNDIIKILKENERRKSPNEEMINQLKVLEDEKQNLITSLETMEQGWIVDKKKIDELEEELSRKVAIEYNTSLAAELEEAEKNNHTEDNIVNQEAHTEIQEVSSQSSSQGSTIQCTPKETRNSSLHLIGDSHVNRLYSCLKSKKNIISHSKGGAKLKDIVELCKNLELLPDDSAIIIGGTNDLFQTSWELMKKQYVELIKETEKCKNVSFLLIMNRYDKLHMNKHISNLNTKIKNLLQTFPSVKIITTKHY